MIGQKKKEEKKKVSEMVVNQILVLHRCNKRFSFLIEASSEHYLTRTQSRRYAERQLKLPSIY